MGLFGKKLNKQDFDEAQKFLEKIRRFCDPVIESFKYDQFRGPVEMTMLTVLSTLCQNAGPPNFFECSYQAIYNSVRWWKMSSPDSCVYLSDLTANTWNDAAKSGKQPLHAVFERLFKGELLERKVFSRNPFFQIDAKRAINETIQMLHVNDLLLACFDLIELIPPKRNLFINLKEAPAIDMSVGGKVSRYFIMYITSAVDKTYVFAVENEGDKPKIGRQIFAEDGSVRLEPVSDEVKEDLLELYLDDYAIFSAYDYPLY